MNILTKKDSIPNDFISASRKHVSEAVHPHFHEFFEIEFVISGNGVCRVDGKEYPFSEGSLFLLTPVNVHEIKSSDAEIFNVMFWCEGEDMSVLHSMLCSSQSPLLRTEGEDSGFIYHMLSELVRVCERDVNYARILLHCLVRKLTEMKRSREQESHTYVQRAILYIAEHFKSGVTLSAVAAHIGFTPTYLSNLFKRETGMSFSAYLDNIRFSYAKNLLVFTDLPITEIHRASGFEDYTNFSRRFRRMFGVSPKEYRLHQR